MKTDKEKTEKVTDEEGIEQPQKKKAAELKTDFPMSEKDEVKQAEQNTNKQRHGSR